MSSILATVESCLIETAPTELFHSTEQWSLSTVIGATWESWTADFERSFTQLESSQDVSNLIGVVEDGLHVALFGLGQVVRQSNLKDPVPDTSVGQVRLNEGARLLSTIAKVPVDVAVPLEQSLGFRSETFNRPTKPLGFYGTSVNAHNLDGIQDVAPLEAGCPFRRNMANLYPKIAALLLDSFQTD